jgi:hypothetical protein
MTVQEPWKFCLFLLVWWQWQTSHLSRTYEICHTYIRTHYVWNIVCMSAVANVIVAQYIEVICIKFNTESVLNMTAAISHSWVFLVCEGLYGRHFSVAGLCLSELVSRTLMPLFCAKTLKLKFRISVHDLEFYSIVFLSVTCWTN